MVDEQPKENHHSLKHLWIPHGHSWIYGCIKTLQCLGILSQVILLKPPDVGKLKSLHLIQVCFDVGDKLETMVLNTDVII